MDENRNVNEEIEDSLRVCQELFEDELDFVPEKPNFAALQELLGDIPKEEKVPEPIQNIPAQKTWQNKPEVPKIDLSETKIWKPEEMEPVRVAVEKTEEPKVEEPKVEEPKVEEPKIEEIKFEPVQKEEKPLPKVELTSEEEDEPRSLKSTLISIGVCVVIALIAAFLITKFVANHTTVEGSSMEPRLKSGDELVVEKVSYLMGEPERFDIIVFKYNQETNYIKRVIGLPGETVQIDEEAKIHINDKVIFDEFANGVMEDFGIAEEEIQLGPDEYFVLGDNRNASKDSRDADVGVVKADQIVGKAWLRVMPFAEFGMIQ